MTYSGTSSNIITDINGSRRLSNIFWAIAVSLGGFGFFLTGLSSFFGVNLLLFVSSTSRGLHAVDCCDIVPQEVERQTRNR